MKTILSKYLIPVLAIVATTLCLVVLCLRLWSCIEAGRSNPGTAVTSGCEEESWLAIWQLTKGQALFPDPTSPPYNAAYFNWLFYKTYAGFSGLFMQRFGDQSLIISGRLLTLLFAAFGTIITFLWIRRNSFASYGISLALALSCLPFFGPLAGWWSLTVRPDIAALTFESLSILCLLYWGREKPWVAAFLSAWALYMAWAFKPSYVAGVPVATLYLLIKAGWKQSGCFCLLTILGWFLTLWLGGEGLRSGLMDSGTNNNFNLNLLIQNSGSALLRIGPLLLLSLAAVPALHQCIRNRSLSILPDATLLGLLGILITLPLYGLAASKEGASINYWFPVGLYLLCLVSGSLSTSDFSKPWLPASLAAIILMQAGILWGAWGKISLRKDSEILADKWEVFQHLPEPRFSYDYRLNMPWLNPGSPPYVLAFNYAADRAKGKVFAENGLGGQIETGKLAGLLLPPESENSYDEVLLSPKFELIKKTPYGSIYLKKE